ncbi:hypothetical protein ACW9UR_19795 [Halovulum sp. GXIMD14794]
MVPDAAGAGFGAMCVRDACQRAVIARGDVDVYRIDVHNVALGLDAGG